MPINFCEHCEGQRFDRARVLRVLRQARRDLRKHGTLSGVDKGLSLAIKTVRTLEIPHLELDEEQAENYVVH